MSTEKKLGARLQSACAYLSAGGTVADIGTDHAYLPIEIIKKGLSQRAIACDINLGPIESARRNIEAAGLSDRIDTMQTDGLHGVECFHPTDILIFGMGGELIAKILSEAPWVKDEEIGLILQPMSHAEILRRWLSENGFAILGETLTYEDQYYQTIHARFNGETYVLTEEEAFFGAKILESESPLVVGYLNKRAETLRSVIAGKTKGNADVSLETRLLDAIKARLEREGEVIE